jgi:hypothetical protein
MAPTNTTKSSTCLTKTKHTDPISHKVVIVEIQQNTRTQ